MKRKHFFTYLNESIALNLPSQLKKDEQSLGLNTREKSVRDIPTMYSNLKNFKKDVSVNDQDVDKVKNLKKIKQKRASILKQHNLKIENGKIISKDKPDGQLNLFQNINISRNENDFGKEIKRKITELSFQIEKDDTEYRKNLKILLKRFFSFGGKMPKRYLYLPVSNTINISQIEKINNNSHLDMLLKIKNGSFVDLKGDVKIDENKKDSTKIFFIYSMISRNENFIKIHSKLMSKNIDIKKHFYSNMMNVIKDNVIDLMSNLILIKELEAQTLFKAFLTYVIEKSIVRSAVIFKIFSNLIIKKANIDLILDFLMSVPSLNFHQTDFNGYQYDDYCDNIKDKEKIKKLNLLISEKMFTENEKLSLGKSPALFIETLKLEDYDFFEKKFLNEKGRIDINNIYDFYYKMVTRPLDKFFEQIDSTLKFFVKYQDRIDDKGLLIGQRLKDRIKEGSNLGFDFIVFLNILKKMAKLGLIKQEDFEMGFSIFKDNIFKYRYYQHVRNFIYACLSNVTKYDKKHYEEMISILGQKISYTNSDDFIARFSDFPFSMFSFEHKHENIKIFFDIFDEKTKNMFIFTYIIESFSFKNDAMEIAKSIIHYLDFEKPFHELINPFVLDNSDGNKTRILIEIMNQYTFFNDMINKEDFVMALTSRFEISLWNFLSKLLHKNDIKNNKIEKAITDSLERIGEDVFGILYQYYLNIFGKQTMKSIAQKNKVIQRKAIDDVQKNIINKRFHRSMAKKKK